jgi:hypothetical protein
MARAGSETDTSTAAMPLCWLIVVTTTYRLCHERGTLRPQCGDAEPRGSPLGGVLMPVESTGDSPGNPRLYKVIEHAPKTGKSPTVWAWPELIDYLKVAGQPVQGPWPPHQQRRPDPEADSLPVAVPDSGPPTSG